ncbi:glycosyltransferase [Salegentibacter sp. F188]|uniref:Glycosyltransferase n=1 Tax=Autumnicola patrickiae TaxID=3075591 RepID=A0ABU3DY07_9FLAO|nr:glycosyltransferase [Salegentibacter sp. F188]MDT0688599.1 glycosyltransferase [Salegentibacter sp. F188]
MEASVLIVSNNRSAELHRTLKVLQEYLDFDRHEILVLLDGCKDDSERLIKLHPEVKWEISEENLGASKARSILYKKAKGNILFGFDDDAHPLQHDFITISSNIFAENSRVGIIAFKEIKGIFKFDAEIPEVLKEGPDYLVKDFLGCGFAIKKEVYEKTRGFPVWIDIYGEEVCVAMETLELGYDILFTHQIVVNHRTQKQKNNTGGANYFRFGKQLKNTASFYLVYYPFPLLLKKIFRLYFLNFKKYGMKNGKFLKEYARALGINAYHLNNVLKHRKPVSKKTIARFNNLSNPTY